MKTVTGIISYTGSNLPTFRDPANTGICLDHGSGGMGNNSYHTPLIHEKVCGFWTFRVDLTTLKFPTNTRVSLFICPLSFATSGVSVATMPAKKKAPAAVTVTVKPASKKTKMKRAYPSTKKRSRARKSYKKDKPSRFAIDLINMAYPHDGSPVIRFPDGQGVETLAMNVVSTGILINNGFSAPYPKNASTDYRYPQNSKAFYFYPGSIQHCMFLEATAIPAEHANGLSLAQKPGPAWVTTSLGNVVGNSLEVTGNYAGISQFTAYRVTGATLKISYIGNPDNSAGEICVVKFDPNTVSPREIVNSTGTDRSIPIKQDDIMHARVERFSAGEGCYISFHRSDNTNFGNFKDIVHQLTGTAPAFDGQDNAPATIAAQSSMEAVAIFFQGTDSANADPSSTYGESKAQWRYELIQTVEFLPKSGTITARLTQETPPHMPLYIAAYDQMYKALKDRAIDIVPAAGAAFVRSAAYQIAKKASTHTAAMHGSVVPNVSIEGGKVLQFFFFTVTSS